MITKTIVKENDRLNFLPQYFGNNFLKFEMLVYSFMDKFAEGYSGGFWKFYTLDNGGAYMSHDSEEHFKVINDMNYFEDIMSADALSIGVNMFAMNYLMCAPHDDRLIDLYYALRDFAAEHKEASKIFRFID